MYSLKNWYPFFIILGLLVTFASIGIWSLRNRHQSNLDTGEALFAICAIVVVLLTGAVVYGGMLNARANTTKAEHIHKMNLEACKQFEDVNQKAICLMNLP